MEHREIVLSESGVLDKVTGFVFTVLGCFTV